MGPGTELVDFGGGVGVGGGHALLAIHGRDQKQIASHSFGHRMLSAAREVVASKVGGVVSPGLRAVA